MSEIPSAPNVEPFNFDAKKLKVFDQLDAFSGVPFTVQRLAELITSPRKHYKRTDKFMRALEKNMLVRNCHAFLYISVGKPGSCAFLSCHLTSDGSGSKIFDPGRVRPFWFGFEFFNFSPSGQKKSLWVGSKSTRVKGGSAPYLLRVINRLG